MHFSPFSFPEESSRFAARALGGLGGFGLDRRALRTSSGGGQHAAGLPAGRAAGEVAGGGCGDRQGVVLFGMGGGALGRSEEGFRCNFGQSLDSSSLFTPLRV